MTATDPVHLEVTVAAPVDAVWRALRDPAEIGRWFGWEYSGLADEIEMIFAKDVVMSEANRTITIGNGDRFELESRGDRTVVRVTRPAPAEGWQGIYDDVTEGWLTFLQQLRFALEHHAGQDRLTLFLAGEPRAAELDAFGLRQVGGAEGERYEWTMPFGATLAGTVWFRSEFQVGLTVDGFGDGLLIVNLKPADAHTPRGTAMLNITAYGLSATAFDEVRRPWTDGWNASYSDTRDAIENQTAG
jgi:hypothetical protein